MITTENNVISIHRTLNSPLESVWKAWTDAESFKKWWGPADYTCPHCSIDFKVGGRYLTCMQSKNGENVWSTGVYKEIVDRKKIVYTDSFADNKGHIVPASFYNIPGEWPMELMVTVELEEKNGKTNLTLTHEGISEDQHADCISGWNQSLDKLEQTARANPSASHDAVKKMNAVVHFELPAEDRNRMSVFYTNAFGWETKMLGEDMGNYTVATTTEIDANGMITTPGAINGGFYTKNEEAPDQYPSFVIGVDNLQEAMKRITLSGGKILGEPMEIPGVGLFVSFYDTEGNRLSVLEPVMKK